ncbi:MAG: hypothetical protein IPI37_11900 [Bacteroidales bacterium]|nr:hypothetical protein [Bacteroidales bacterium]
MAHSFLFMFRVILTKSSIGMLTFGGTGAGRGAQLFLPVGFSREAGRTMQWFLPGGFSREAGPIKHQLVLECRSGGSARKNQSRHEAPIAYTNLLPCVAIQFYFNYLIINQSVIKIVF